MSMIWDLKKKIQETTKKDAWIWHRETMQHLKSTFNALYCFVFSVTLNVIHHILNQVLFSCSECTKYSRPDRSRSSRVSVELECSLSST